MERISLDVRLHGTSDHEPISEALARVPVDEFFDVIQSLIGPCESTMDKVYSTMVANGLRVFAPMCYAIGKVSDPFYDDSDLLMYNLAILPFYWLYTNTTEVENHE